MVAEILLAASSVVSSGDYYAGTEEDLAEVLLWLKREELRGKLRKLETEIGSADRNGRDCMDLLLEKQSIDKELRALEQQ